MPSHLILLQHCQTQKEEGFSTAQNPVHLWVIDSIPFTCVISFTYMVVVLLMNLGHASTHKFELHNYPPWNSQLAPENRPSPKRKFHLPTVDVQRRTVNIRDGTWQLHWPCSSSVYPFTLPKFNMFALKKWWFSIHLSFWDGIFSGAVKR